ncbi:MAG: hypothetical protein FD161_729 [Limisphaerales bacterium]|nr:MAG: hypothetical protein FD161_729 [Limisphaerales bacterium]KAG0510087.1 MAG: hypothetical protein E1N63_729 [Limisphaerales bacterium]TXT52930.1 MAG: hypothetical protein FD140_38 [Limisphaerales bacterium]
MAKQNLLGTSTINLRTLLANGKRYEVPPYQRDYSWKEEHWEDLWFDLLELEGTGRQHYMGALVLEEEQSDDFRVIDGQQRLATLSVLVVGALRCLNELIAAGVEAVDNKKRVDLLRTAFLGSEHPVTLKTTPKLTLNQANRRFYEGTLLDLQTPPSVASLPPTERPLWDALVFFENKLREKFVTKRDGAALAKFVYETIATKLLFIQVIVEDEAGAYTVFETLNARGLELTAGDLLKNYLLSVIHPTGDGNLRLTQQRWLEITERIPAREIAEFLRHYLNSTRPFVRQERVYKTIRSDVTKPQQIFQLLDELKRAALLNEALEDPTHALWDEIPDAKKSVRHLRLYGVVQYRPLVFAVWRKLNRADLAPVLRVCDVVSFRYNMISQRNTNRLEEVYNDVAVAVHKGTLATAADVQKALQVVYVSDDEFKEAFAKRTIPTGGRKTRLLRYILCALEKQEHNVDYDWENTPATIEHVLPESPSAEWMQDFPGELHERYVSRLGNYLLLESKLNSKEAANKPLTEKLPIYQQSQYPTTKQFSAPDWTAQNIEGRQAHMAKLATAIWRI